jgi:NTP pyrophosphatase (non-canonical NTP hydrolase)
MDKMIELMTDVADWHHARNLIAGSTDQAQFVKLIEEGGELAGNIARGKDIEDDVGDMVVVLINIAERNNTTLYECLKVAWGDIKDRTGIMVDGVFIKQEDITAVHLLAVETAKKQEAALEALMEV